MVEHYGFGLWRHRPGEAGNKEYRITNSDNSISTSLSQVKQKLMVEHYSFGLWRHRPGEPGFEYGAFGILNTLL